MISTWGLRLHLPLQPYLRQLLIRSRYHTTLILLFRPFYQSTEPSPAYRELSRHAHKVCRAEAEAVNSKFRAYGRTFNYRNQTHLLSYCVYTAATVDVQGMQSKDQAEAQAAMERLNITLHMLDTEAEQTPGIRKSVDIIRDQIAQIGPKVPKQDDAQPILFDQSTSQSLEHPVSPPVSIQSGLNDMSTGPAASFQQSDSSGILPNLAQPTLQYVDQQLFPQQYDPMLSVQGFENMGDMSWFDWNEHDISGGFGSYGYDNW